MQLLIAYMLASSLTNLLYDADSPFVSRYSRSGCFTDSSFCFVKQTNKYAYYLDLNTALVLLLRLYAFLFFALTIITA